MRFAWLALLPLVGTSSESFVDRHLESKFGDVRPTGPCSEAEFLRRVHLDLAGVVPTVEEARAYLARPEREKLVDQLLQTPDFDAWWARFLLELTTDRRAARYDGYNGRLLFDWFREQLRLRRSYRKIVIDLLCARGTWEESPAANFLLRYGARPTDLTGAVGRAFLGVKLQCAQCHDHPFEPRKREDFWSVAAFFARTKRTYVEDSDVVGVTEVGPGETAAPARWLGAKEPAVRADRAQLAEHVVADPLFAKNIVNRIWARLMGAGLVEPLDGLGGEAEPTHPELLQALADHFVRSDYDLRATIRLIVTSKAYQRSSQAKGSEPRLFARALVRPLSPDQLYRSLLRATRYGLDEEVETDPDQEDLLAAEWFGAPRTTLSLLNRPEIHGMVESGARHVLKTLGRPVGRGHFEHLYLALLSRLPSDEERKLFEGMNRRSDLEDLLWALINSIEFRTNH